MSPADQSPANSPLSNLPLIVTAVPPASAAIVILFASSIVTLVMVPSKSGISVGRHGCIRRYGRYEVYFPKGRKTRLRIAYSRALFKEIFRKALKAVVFPARENKNGWQAIARQPSSHLTYPSEGTTK